MKIGIDASRSRSGGGKAHLIGILSNIVSLPNEIDEVHVWSYGSLLDSLPDYPWLIKHCPEESDKSLFSQLWWQYSKLPKEAKKAGVDIMLNTDAGTVCRFMPSVTMSRDMLSYEKGEMKRFGMSFQRLRLIALKYVQNYSLKNSSAAIFLTEYASKVIQESCGRLNNYTIINHGISSDFVHDVRSWKNSERGSDPIRCIYISTVALYKHQWHIAEAIADLRTKGNNITINFIGGGDGKAQVKFTDCINKLDTEREFITQREFVKHSDIPELLNESDIFIFASSCENMPNTLIEGMSAGLPILCSDRGPMPEILKDGGLYFDPENSLTIASALENIIDNEDLRFNKTKISKELSYQYSWKKCSQETFNYIVNVYKSFNK